MKAHVGDGSDRQDLGSLSPEASALCDLVRESSRPMSPYQQAGGLEGVMRRLARRLRPQRAPVVIGLLVGGAIAVLAIAVAPELARRARLTAPLAYHVDGGELGAGGFVRAGASATPGHQPVVRFSDGSEVKLAAGARVRLTSVDADGARFAIEEGAANVHVVPRARAHWSFDAGPFLIAVHGTVFTAAWDGAQERLDVHLDRGLVSVTGPLAEAPIAVRGGQRLTVALRDREVRLREVDGPAADTADSAARATDEPSVPAAAAAGGAHHRSSRPAAAATVAVATPAAPAPPRSWSEALAAGDLDVIIRDAEDDLGHALAARDLDDLAALADAARYRRLNDIARRALLAERRRFPESRRAHEAAFLLGRIEDSAGTDPIHARARAIDWYDRYLDEEPAGTYGCEALGRKMTAVERLYGPARARAVAEEYMRRYPTGTYAGAARALLAGQ